MKNVNLLYTSASPFLLLINTPFFVPINLVVCLPLLSKAEGEFEKVQCTYNLKTNTAVNCYCIGPKGVLLSTLSPAATPPTCTGNDE
jgi:hypothetical protein